MKKVISLALAVALSGCATTAVEQGSVVKVNKDGSRIENLSDYAIYAKIATEAKPLFEMTCPTTGCVMLSLKVNAPQDKGAVQAPAVAEPAGNVFMKGLFSLAHDALGLAPWYFGARVLTKAFDKANSSVTTTTTMIDDSNRSVNNDSSNHSVTNTTNTTTTTTTTNNSNNRTCTSGTAGAGTTTGGASGPASC